MAFPFSFPNGSTQYIPSVSPAWYRYEAARSFDLDDDLEFCPGLLSEDEIQHISTSYSDRSSSSSGSPNSSPLQTQIQPSNSASPYPPSQVNTPSGVLTPSNTRLSHTSMSSSSSRPRNAIPIVNPQTGMRVSSPPLSSSNSPRATVHPSQQARRHW